jgi:hypothetical protein
LLWTIIGGVAAILVPVPQDLVMLAAGLLAITAIWQRLPKPPPEAGAR